MTDEELEKYINSFGDRLALRAFCHQIMAGPSTSGAMEKTTVLQRLRDKLRRKHKDHGNGDGLSNKQVGNKHAAKESRRVEIGWLHFQMGEFHQVKTKNGGGTRHLTCQKNVKIEELMKTGKELFFPHGLSPKGHAEKFIFEIRDFSQNIVSPECTVCQLYDQTKLRMLRLYICTTEIHTICPQRDPSSDSSYDFHPDEQTLEKLSKVGTSMIVFTNDGKTVLGFVSYIFF